MVATLRADFTTARCYPGLSGGCAAPGRHPLTESELKQAIIQPAGALVRASTSSWSRIVSDVGEQPGAPPLLQYALTGRSSAATAARSR